MKQTIILSVLILVVGAYLAEELKRIEWLMEQNQKSFDNFLKDSVKEQESVTE